jgi:tetratricopeptide (TPR) repeat protein
MKKLHRLRLSVLCTFSFIIVAHAADVGGLMRQGNNLYNRGKHDEALSRYQMAEVLEPDATSIHFNLGNALFRLGRYQDAARELELVMIDKKPERRANAMYNMGNVAFKAGQLDPAIKAYAGALAINPNDRQAKQNLEFCLKKKQEQQNKPDSSKQNQQQNQHQQQNQQQQQQQQQPQPKQGMDKNQAERIVQAVENKEKEEQKKQRQAGGKKQVEQDW